MTEHQVHQVLLLPACVGGDVAQQQVLAQVFHSELHEPRPLEGGAAQQVAGGAAAQVLLKHRAQGAETLLTIAADVLLEGEEIQRRDVISDSFSSDGRKPTFSTPSFKKLHFSSFQNSPTSVSILNYLSSMSLSMNKLTVYRKGFHRFEL